MYIVWLWYITPTVPTFDTALFIGLSLFLWYSFVRAWKGDPGTITLTKNERYKVRPTPDSFDDFRVVCVSQTFVFDYFFGNRPSLIWQKKMDLTLSFFVPRA